MPRKWSKAVPKGNSPVPRDEGPDQSTMADLYRVIEELLEQSNRKLDELTKEMRGIRQRLVGLEQEDARQPHLTKTRKRMEDVAAERVISRDNSSAEVNPDPMRPPSFGDNSTGLSALLCSSNGALVDNGAAAPNPCLSPAEIRTRTLTSGLLPAGIAFTAMKAMFSRPFFSWSLGETKKHTSRINNQLAPFWRRGIQTK